MTERIRWKARHDALAIENDRLEQELVVATDRIGELEHKAGQLQVELEAAKERIASAKLEGMDCAVRGFKALLLQGAPE